MEATEAAQLDLLALANLDVEIMRSRRAIAELSDPALYATERGLQLELASKVIDARNLLDSIELELKRAETDLQLVEQRIAKDNERLAVTNSPKDAQGIQSELVSLAARKSDLEDAELYILERKEGAQSEYEAIAAQKHLVDADLEVAMSANEQQLLKLRSGLDLQIQDRAQQASRIAPDLLELFEKKASRGIPAARLVGRECGACRISLGASAYAEVSGLAKNIIATCPDCQAILIR
jgi:predicted  nucleic acid-binding Zn-ribbon protein